MKIPRQSGARPTAVVMNMFYTGLGIARSLGERGISVTGLTAQRGVYGNFTRYAKVILAPDSRKRPEALLEFLLKMGREPGGRGAVIFPTRDDDLVFLDRYRAQLEPYFHIAAPEHSVLSKCLNKWETWLAAQEAQVASPGCWLIEEPGDIDRIAGRVSYPCVLKPLAAYHWRQGSNWERVGARKAIGIHSEAELRAEYQAIAQADERALLQEMVAGADDCLVIVACYLDRNSRWIAGFNTQKVLQIPAGFGTGCIVQSVWCPELFAPTIRLLESIRYSGIAEVEYKWDAKAGEYKLIEINPRPWDQHRLGNAAGIDLIYTAYCEHAGLPLPQTGRPAAGHKWIAEDTFWTALIRSLRRGVPRPGDFFRLARGKKIYAIWSAKDPLPAMVCWVMFAAGLAGAGIRALREAWKRQFIRKVTPKRKELVYETHVEKPESFG